MFSKRVLSDINVFNNSSTTNIYIIPDEENNVIRAMIIGHKDTPYKFGYYFFSIRFPDDKNTGKYPFVPPTVVFETSDGKTRFNPNLYICGKVCLSILGTWAGPAWTPAGTFLTALLSIQADVMTELPLLNEPGYEKASKTDIDEYSNLVEHQNFAYALIHQIQNPPKGFECFNDLMWKNVRENKNMIANILEKNCERFKEKHSFKTDYAGQHIVNNYPEIYNQFNKLL
jgi:ubiquitin-protein ligase